MKDVIIVGSDLEDMRCYHHTPCGMHIFPQAGSQIASIFDGSILDFVADLEALPHDPPPVLSVVPKKTNKTYGPRRIGKRGKILKW